MVTSLMYLLLREMKMNVREMHTRKPQLARARVFEEFRESKRLILVTSDVSARGMNYPDVTMVIQVFVKLKMFFSLSSQQSLALALSISLSIYIYIYMTQYRMLVITSAKECSLVLPDILSSA